MQTERHDPSYGAAAGAGGAAAFQAVTEPSVWPPTTSLLIGSYAMLLPLPTSARRPASDETGCEVAAEPCSRATLSHKLLDMSPDPV
jgi:hypothetical protein